MKEVSVERPGPAVARSTTATDRTAGEETEMVVDLRPLTDGIALLDRVHSALADFEATLERASVHRR